MHSQSAFIVFSATFIGINNGSNIYVYVGVLDSISAKNGNKTASAFMK